MDVKALSEQNLRLLEPPEVTYVEVVDDHNLIISFSYGFDKPVNLKQFVESGVIPTDGIHHFDIEGDFVSWPTTQALSVHLLYGLARRQELGVSIETDVALPALKQKTVKIELKDEGEGVVTISTASIILALINSGIDGADLAEWMMDFYCAMSVAAEGQEAYVPAQIQGYFQSRAYGVQFA
ncbi:MAG: hypothetical protein V7744_11635 [Pseudomonadales bacterium]